VILEGKTLVVSGVGEGLGGEVARLAHRDGANLMLAARTPATLESIAAEIDPSGERVAQRPTDITDPGQCRALADETVERFGGVDALVQVAALDTVFGGLAEAKPEDWRSTFEVNVVGTAQVSAAMVPHMKQRGGGSIVLIGSQSSFLVKSQAKRRGVSDQDVLAEITSQMAIPEIPADEDVAEAALFFCCDRARLITGQTLFVNSGELMR
jgi:NAD(P)-dependent dehydrogenase (short-subunit alcohol dehydrogenase family)